MIAIINVSIVDNMYFHVLVPCGLSWPGMIKTPDVQIVLDRAMDHVEQCDECRKPQVP